MDARRPTAALAPQRMLELWEQGAGISPIERALLLAGTCVDDPASLPIGARDAVLLDLRRATFGDRIDARTTCLSCGEELEFTLSASTLLPLGYASVEDATGIVEHDGRAVHFRVPTSTDILAVVAEGDAAADALFVRCMGPHGDDADDGLRDAVSRAIAAADPLADVSIALRCPSCGESADVPFDIGALFWAELDAWARRTLAEVDVLARAYGWTERDVLALGPRRRAAYLELAAAR